MAKKPAKKKKTSQRATSGPARPHMPAQQLSVRGKHALDLQKQGLKPGSRVTITLTGRITEQGIETFDKDLPFARVEGNDVAIAVSTPKTRKAAKKRAKPAQKRAKRSTQARTPKKRKVPKKATKRRSVAPKKRSRVL